MKSITLISNAKLNLALDILGVEKRKGKFFGYHRIRTILHEITEKNCENFKPDIVTIEVKRSTTKLNEIHVFSTSKILPTNNKNLAYKAAEEMLKIANKGQKPKPRRLSQDFTISISLTKNIPISSGLGGGSGNAAAVIKGLNKLLNLKLATKELQKIAAKISMDAPFFIVGKTALATHFGEKITQLPRVKNLRFTLFPKSSKLKNKTARAYSSLSLKKCGKNTSKTTQLLRALRAASTAKTKPTAQKIIPYVHNDFETIRTTPRQKKPIQQNTHLTGAGPTRFKTLPC